MKEEDKRCGNCKHWDSDMSWCPEAGKTMYEMDCCDDGWRDDNDGSPAIIGEVEK